MKTNQAGLDLIKHFEGVRLKAYLDTGGVPTIGVGHTKGVKMGQTASEAQVDAWLKEDLAHAEATVLKLVKVKLSDNQFAALSSFVFNLGEGQFAKSTLLRKLNAGDYNGAADEFLRWNKDNGKVIAGLTRRREAERKLFLTYGEYML